MTEQHDKICTSCGENTATIVDCPEHPYCQPCFDQGLTQQTTCPTCISHEQTTDSVECVLCNEMVAKSDLQLHSCSSTKERKCPFYNVGCEETMQPSELAIHLESSVTHHLRIVCDFSVKLYKENMELNKMVAALQKENAHLKEAMQQKDGISETNTQSYTPSESFLASFSHNPRQVIETLLTTTKTEPQDLIYAMERINPETRQGLVKEFHSDIIETAMVCVWHPSIGSQSFTPSPDLAMKLLDWCTEKSHVATACVSLAQSFDTPINCSQSAEKLGTWLMWSNGIREMLLYAKLKLSEHPSIGSGIMELCDNLLTNTNLINEIVKTSGIDFDVSLLDFNDPKKQRALRDALVEFKKFALARDIALKCRIEVDSVWAQWGLHLLQKGNFSDARLKFQRCLIQQKNVKSGPIDRTRKQTGVSSIDCTRVLDNIIQLLTNASPQAQPNTFFLPKKEDRPTSPRGHGEKQEAEKIPTKNLTECIFYLYNYGTPKAVIEFYLRFQRIRPAIEFCLEADVKPELFVELVAIHCINNKSEPELRQAIKSIDPTLQKTKNYLLATCHHLNKTQQFKLLVSWQVLMKDYVRAGLTCIKIFTETADVEYRVKCLKVAQDYFIEAQHLLNKPHANKVSPITGSTAALEDVKKYLSRIQLQLQVINHMNLDPIQSYPNIAGSAVPVNEVTTYTLFGTKIEQSVIALYLILDPKRLDIGLKVMDNCRINQAGIFMKAAYFIAKQPLENFDDDLNPGKEAAILNKEQQINEFTFLIQRLLKDSEWDQMINVVIKAVVALHQEDDTLPSKFIQQLRLPASKVEAYINCNKLKTAYTEAAKLGNVELVTLVQEAATKSNSTTVENLCSKFLQLNKK